MTALFASLWTRNRWKKILRENIRDRSPYSGVVFYIHVFDGNFIAKLKLNYGKPSLVVYRILFHV